MPPDRNNSPVDKNHITQETRSARVPLKELLCSELSSGYVFLFQITLLKSPLTFFDLYNTGHRQFILLSPSIFVKVFKFI